ncbi:MAG: Hpt domain-containing protein [Flavobacteriaceae bacterium]
MIYNLEKINDMADGDQDFIVSVVATFIEEVPQDLASLENALEANDHDQVYKLAHKIKPNVDLLGMEQTRLAALEMETLGKNGADIHEIKAIFPTLKTDIHQVVGELKKDFGL